MVDGGKGESGAGKRGLGDKVDLYRVIVGNWKTVPIEEQK